MSALKPSEADLGKSSSNLNQIAHVLNTGRRRNLLEATLQAHLEVLRHHEQAVRDLK